jgi:hypothetical protein
MLAISSAFAWTIQKSMTSTAYSSERIGVVCLLWVESGAFDASLEAIARWEHSRSRGEGANRWREFF